MAETDLRVKIIPDTKELDKALKGKKLGLGVNGAGGGGAGGKRETKVAGFRDIHDLLEVRKLEEKLMFIVDFFDITEKDLKFDKELEGGKQ